MVSTDVFERAKLIYEERLRGELERLHLHEFVAIDPESGDFFLGPTLSDAAAAAHAKYPGRVCGVLRVGHETTVHIGATSIGPESWMIPGARFCASA